VSSNGTVRLKDIWAMLERCAPGYDVKETKHYWRITYKSVVYPTFPKGPHGDRSNPSIQIGHIKHMTRLLGILDCAKDCLPQLK